LKNNLILVIVLKVKDFSYNVDGEVMFIL